MKRRPDGRGRRWGGGGGGGDECVGDDRWGVAEVMMGPSGLVGPQLRRRNEGTGGVSVEMRGENSFIESISSNNELKAGKICYRNICIKFRDFFGIVKRRVCDVSNKY